MSMNTKHMNKYTKKRKLVRNNSYTKNVFDISYVPQGYIYYKTQ